MKKITRWQAADGSIFSSAAQCNAYEQSRNLREYITKEDWLKEIYARMTVHLYKHHLTKVNEGWSPLLRVRQDYGYKIAHWKKLLDNNRNVWDYTKVPANRLLKEFIYNRHLYQSNESEIAQLYLPERLLTLDLTKDITNQILHNIKHIKGFYKVKVEYSNYFYCSPDSHIYLFALTNKSKLVYKSNRSLTNVYSIRTYSKDKPLTLIEKVNKLMIEIPCV